MLTCLHNTYDCFYTRVADLSSLHKDQMAGKA